MIHTPRHEEDLIQGCLDGDSGCQEKLYKLYYSTLLKICARYVTNMEDAETLMHDAFLKIFSRLDSFQFKGSFEGWMKRITVNTCLDFIRTREFERRRKFVDIKAVNVADSIQLEDDLIQRYEFNKLLQDIQSLPDLLRTVFNLYVFEEYSHKEIGKELGIQENTSQWYLHQARKTLKEIIRKSSTEKTK